MNENKVFAQLRGDIFMKMVHADGSVETRECENIIVDVASQLMAVLMSRDGTVDRPYVSGALVLAVGTGDSGWDLQNPPAATGAQEFLFNELDRNVFNDVTFVDPITFVPSSDQYADRTKVVEFTTTFGDSEAVGPLVEMGLFGGTGATGANSGIMINYKTFKVWNNPACSTFTITWRLTF